jgi:hypothetical protein
VVILNERIGQNVILKPRDEAKDLPRTRRRVSCVRFERRCHRLRDLHSAITLSLIIIFATMLSATPATSTWAQGEQATSTTSTTADAAKAVHRATISPWKPVFVGVETCNASTEAPLRLQVRAVRVDLREPSIRFLVTPSNGDEPLDCDARTTSQFLAEFGCQVAINGSAFHPFAKAPKDPQDVVGLSMSRGEHYSPGNEFDALMISQDRRVWIDRAPIDVEGAHNALSGFHALLIDGENNGQMEKRHPRSAVGVSQDGRTLILMTIDGRQPETSVGTTTAETAEWMRALGAHHALNLDGGGSTALVIEETEGKPRVLNRPCGGKQRLVANHLGVYAKSLAQVSSDDQ